jgi:hypothetical protein
VQKDFDDAVAHRQRCGLIPVGIARGFARLAQGVGELRQDCFAKLGFVVIPPGDDAFANAFNFDARVLRQGGVSLDTLRRLLPREGPLLDSRPSS